MYWLSVERHENWMIDKSSDFRSLGISDRKVKLAEQIRKGDYIISYISSGYSCFSDVRKVISEKPTKARKDVIYDEPFSFQISTEPYFILPEEKWIKIHSLIGRLGFLPAEKDWRQVMRNSLRKLDDDDASLIIAAIEGAARDA